MCRILLLFLGLALSTSSAISAPQSSANCAEFYQNTNPGVMASADPRIGRRETRKGRQWSASELAPQQSVPNPGGRQFVVFNHALADTRDPSFLAAIAINYYPVGYAPTQDLFIRRNEKWTRDGRQYTNLARLRHALDELLERNITEPGTCERLIEIYDHRSSGPRPVAWYLETDLLLQKATNETEPVLFDGEPKDSDDDTLTAMKVLGPQAKRELRACKTQDVPCDCRIFYLRFTPFTDPGCSSAPVSFDINTAGANKTVVFAFSPAASDMQMRYELTYPQSPYP